ncbi:conserved Plasmodium protein, unknown function [Plasmodium malariae]|uniref:Uncharacterized protein n=1 Tax=Plasmodium malariae TaxID=5858 RepID=A0A1C3KDG3_PLAMA|nr:conserved Plasmodium protein, unknown function [Plasmodium malariae]
MELRKRKSANFKTYRKYGDNFSYKKYVSKEKAATINGNIATDHLRKIGISESSGITLASEWKGKKYLSQLSQNEEYDHEGGSHNYIDGSSDIYVDGGSDNYIGCVSENNEYELSSNNDDWCDNSSYTLTNYGVKKKKKKKMKRCKVNDNDKVIVPTFDKGKRKKYKNSINDRIKTFLKEQKEYYYDLDLFSYLNNENGKEESNECNENGEKCKDGVTFALFIISEIEKGINCVELVEENKICTNGIYSRDDRDGKGDICRGNSRNGRVIKRAVSAEQNDEVQSAINVKEGINFECIINYDSKNLKNIFFFENINIEYNNKELTLCPFGSEVVFDNKPSDVVRHKKLLLKNECNMKENSTSNYMDVTTEIVIKLKRHFTNKRNINMMNYFYLNDKNYVLISEIIQFFYFLLLCNYLYSDNNSYGEGEKRIKGRGMHKSGLLTINNIMHKLNVHIDKDLTVENIFLSLCAPVIYLDFSDSINIVNFLAHLLNEFPDGMLSGCEKQNDVKSTDEEEKDYNYNVTTSEEGIKKDDIYKYISNELINDFLFKCRKVFNGSLLSISVCSYLDNSMFFSSLKKNRNFVFIYFISQYLGKPIFFDIIELNQMCKKLEWIKLNSISERKGKEYIYLLICLLGNRISIFGISKYNFFQKLYYSLKNEHKYLDFTKYMEHNLLKSKFKRLFTYKSKELLNDFSYTICVQENKRFLKLAVCSNDFKLKIISVLLNEWNKDKNKISSFLKRSPTMNITFQGCNSSLDLVFKKKRIFTCRTFGMVYTNDMHLSCDHVNQRGTHCPKKGNHVDRVEAQNVIDPNEGKNKNKKKENKKEKEKEEVKEEAKDPILTAHINGKKGENWHCKGHTEGTEATNERYDITVCEDYIYLQHGILSLCSFYPCINSYLLCISTKEGDIIIIDIRNNSELFFFKRKTETVTHLKWHSNSCILFGQDKGCILHLFENKFFLNIDKTWNNLIDILCLHSYIINDTYMFIFDDGSIIKGELKGSTSKVRPNEILLWKTTNFELDPDILLKISFTQNDQIKAVSLILLYEYLRGLQHILTNGIKISKSKKLEAKVSRKTIALMPKSISIAVFDKNCLTAYGNAAGLIHILSRGKEVEDLSEN